MHHDPSSAALAVAQYEAERRQVHDKTQQRNVQLYALGRILVAMLFLLSGAAKLVSYSQTVAALRDTLSAPEVLVPLGIALEMIGGTLLLVGFKARATALMLMAYLAAVTALIHHDLSEPLNRAFALGNLSFAGALLMIFSHGAGALSLDRLTGRG